MDRVHSLEEIHDARGEPREPLQLLVHHHQVADGRTGRLDERVALPVPRRNLSRGPRGRVRQEREREHGPADHAREVLDEVLVDDPLLELEVKVKGGPRRGLVQLGVQDVLFPRGAVQERHLLRVGDESRVHPSKVPFQLLRAGDVLGEGRRDGANHRAREEKVRVQNRQTRVPHVFAHPVRGQHHVQEGFERPGEEVGCRGAELVEVLDDPLVRVVQVTHPQHGGSVVRPVGEVPGVNVRGEPLPEGDGDGVGEVLERRVHDARRDAGDEEIAEDHEKLLPRPFHHRLQAVAALASDAQRDERPGDEHHGLDGEQHGLLARDPRDDDAEDERHALQEGGVDRRDLPLDGSRGPGLGERLPAIATAVLRAFVVRGWRG